MYHLLGTVAAGAALSDGSAAIEPFCSALSKQHIFLVCARLVLVPCILPHGLTLHVLFSSCSATACVSVGVLSSQLWGLSSPSMAVLGQQQELLLLGLALRSLGWGWNCSLGEEAFRTELEEQKYLCSPLWRG